MSATLTHLATGPLGHATTPNTSVLTGLTRTQPLIITDPAPLQQSPTARLTSIPRTDPNPAYFHAPNTGAPLLTNIYTNRRQKQGVTVNTPKNRSTKPFRRPCSLRYEAIGGGSATTLGPQPALARSPSRWATPPRSHARAPPPRPHAPDIPRALPGSLRTPAREDRRVSMAILPPECWAFTSGGGDGGVVVVRDWVWPGTFRLRGPLPLQPPCSLR